MCIVIPSMLKAAVPVGASNKIFGKSGSSPSVLSII